MGAKRNVPAFVYIAQHIGEQRLEGDFYQYKYKVGWSRNLVTRLVDINKGITEAIEYIHIFYFFNDAYQIELDLKKLFVGYTNKGRMNSRMLKGELFWAYPEQIDVVARWISVMGGIGMDYEDAMLVDIPTNNMEETDG